MRMLFLVVFFFVGCHEQKSEKEDSQETSQAASEQQGTKPETSTSDSCKEEPVSSGCCKALTPECDACFEKEKQDKNNWVLKCVDPEKIVYTSSGDALEYVETQVQSCDRICPETDELADAFEKKCLEKGFKTVPGYCCSIFCTGSIQ
jgi:hypothetical protein